MNEAAEKQKQAFETVCGALETLPDDDSRIRVLRAAAILLGLDDETAG